MRSRFADRVRPALLAAFAAGVACASDPVMYAVDCFKDELVRIDLRSGKADSIGPIGFNGNSWGLAFSPVELVGRGGVVYPSGTLFGLDDYTDLLYTFDLRTGRASPVDFPIFIDYGKSLAFDAEGRLYAMEFNALYELDLAAGKPTVVLETNFGPDGIDIAVTPVAFGDGHVFPPGTLFGVDSGALYALDIRENKSTELGKPGFNLVNETLAFGPDGTLYGLGDAGAQDVLTELHFMPLGATVIGATGHGGLWGAAIIPEPASLLLVSLALLALRVAR